ncbi:MAG: ethanolamine ammonia-lyase reactivating factor EutA, partial [Synergistaceae bacterium]|nr:ethanolamine ammonia-lyase reactivating factor EutA [Synergistaceae bacterium]
IGGRLVRVEGGRVTYIADNIAALCSDSGIRLSVGDRADETLLFTLAKVMAEMLEMSLGLREKSKMYPRMLTGGRDFVIPSPITDLCFSGGVADHIYSDSADSTPFLHGDIGVLLGRAIRESRALAGVKRFIPNETIRATVVGAGTHITEISGSTIDYDVELLPLKNLPILKLTPEDERDSESIRDAISKKLEWFSFEGEIQSAAISITGKRSPGFLEVQENARAILSGAAKMLEAGHPLVVVSENDMAKALGNTLRACMTRRCPLVSIDSITVKDGDYIDIGRPVASGNVLPVIVKTLLFV